MPEPSPTNQTAVILTALDVETRAVLRHLAGISTETVSGTGFFRGQFEGWDIVVAEAGPGNVGAAAISGRACEHYQPKVALLVGVAGGVKDVAVGDVVVATKVYGYESGKDQTAGLKVRPTLLTSAHALEQRARIVRQIEHWKSRLDPQIGHKSPSLFVGPIAAGEKVVASKHASVAKLLHQHFGDTLAVEMEGYGFLEGVHINHPVQGCVVRGISDLLSGKANADRTGSQQRAADVASAVAFQLLSGFDTNVTRPPTSAVPEATALNLSDLKSLAAALLEVGAPPSVAMLFPGAPATARAALGLADVLERNIIEINPSTSGPVRTLVAALASTEQQKHLILGPPGSGKSHALWHAADQLLNGSDVIPLFLPAGQVDKWDDLTSMIRESAPTLSLDRVIHDPRVCMLIDGWSEFASGKYAGEKQKCLRALRNTRVIANAKIFDVGDTPFKTWSLELLSPQQVADVLDMARPGSPALPSPVLDLLRLPLLLSIHVLSGAKAATTGDLLRQFHEHLARDLPEGFTAALAKAVASSAVAGDRAYGRLVLDLQTYAATIGVAEPARLLQRLGTIAERNGQALPVHDLYWSWLAGRGLMADQHVNVAIDRLHTRESYRLALQSGARPRDADIVATVDDDLVPAATFDASRRSAHLEPALAAGINRTLTDSRLTPTVAS